MDSAIRGVFGVGGDYDIGEDEYTVQYKLPDGVNCRDGCMLQVCWFALPVTLVLAMGWIQPNFNALDVAIILSVPSWCASFFVSCSVPPL